MKKNEKYYNYRKDSFRGSICAFRNQPFPDDRLLSWNAHIVYTARGVYNNLTGIMLIAASISIITKKFVKFSTLMLAVLLFMFIITIHIPHLF